MPDSRVQLQESDVVAAYCASHYVYDAISLSRQRQQPKVLRAFEATLTVPFEQAGRQELRAYVEGRVNAGLHVNTVRKELHMILPVYTWLHENEVIDDVALMRIRSVHAPRGSTGQATPNPYDRRQITRLWTEVARAYPWARRGAGTLDVAELYLQRWRNDQSKWLRVQPYFMRLQVEAIIVLALHGGLRMDEIWRLTPEQMHPENDYMLVVGARKNSRGEAVTRVVPWTTQEFRDSVARWHYARAEIVAREGDPGHERPWLSLYGVYRLRAMRRRVFEDLLWKIGSGWGYHRLRHTAATEMVRADYHLEAARKILGHGSIEQTRQYVKLVEDDLVAAAARGSERMAGNLSREP